MHRNIKILLTASILIHSATNLFAPIYAIFMENIGGDILDAGIAMGIYAGLKGIFYFLFNKLPETTWSKRIMIILGYSIMGVCYLLYIAASNPVQMYFIQALLSAGETIVTPSWSAVIAMSLKKGEERHTYSHFYGYRSMFEGAAAVAGGFFVITFGFDLMFAFMAVLAFLSAVISGFITETGINST